MYIKSGMLREKCDTILASMLHACHSISIVYAHRIHIVFIFISWCTSLTCIWINIGILYQNTIIALWWWFCPCRVGGAVWNHTAWLFPLMPLPTESLFYSYFLSCNKYRKKHHLCKYWAISVLFQFITISIDLKIAFFCTMSKVLKSKMICWCCIHNTFGKTIGPHVTVVTQLIVSWNLRILQTKVVMND